MTSRLFNLSTGERVLVSALVVLCLCTGLYRLGLAKPIKTYLDNQRQLTEVQQEITRAKQILAAEKIRQRQAAAMTDKLAALRPSFNTNVQTGAMLVELSRQARQAGAVLQWIKPWPAAAGQHLSETPFTLQIDGSYNQVVQYVNRLENLPQAAEIRRIHLRPGDSGRLSGSSETAAEIPAWYQNGEVQAEIEVVFFTANGSPASPNRAAETATNGAVGRANAFQAAYPLSSRQNLNSFPADVNKPGN
ncbi:type 4a pilus biogenesis protein PilO [Desulforamulus hydrothermalis]|nr:type 4a pilus biogenesis protein PilO [Desulforamulus hydrothermalis]SHG73780.1 Pilus assembly protein, PilO [Desulforamulus hydrothermalis Lam5 = DSM 18033]